MDKVDVMDTVDASSIHPEGERWNSPFRLQGPPVHILGHNGGSELPNLGLRVLGDPFAQRGVGIHEQRFHLGPVRICAARVA